MLNKIATILASSDSVVIKQAIPLAFNATADAFKRMAEGELRNFVLEAETFVLPKGFKSEDLFLSAATSISAIHGLRRRLE